MIKITLKNGITIEGDNAAELVKFVDRSEKASISKLSPELETRVGKRKMYKRVPWKKYEVAKIRETLNTPVSQVFPLLPHRSTTSVRNLRAMMRKGRVSDSVRRMLNEIADENIHQE